MNLPHRLDRTVVIPAAREVVFRYFTDSARWAAWWGPGSTIDARPGGRVLIRMPGGVEAAGEVIEAAPPERIVFTYGFVSGQPIPAGSSRVTIRLEPEDSSTRLHLMHEFAEAPVRDEHVQGWRYQLSLFGNLVADELHRSAARTVDAWFDAWAEANADARARALGHVATPQVRMRDRFSLVDGLDDLTAHIGAAQKFMPNIRIRRSGDVRHCQGMLLVDWVAVMQDERTQASGTNVFVLDATGRIESVTGFWSPLPVLPSGDDVRRQ